MCLTYLIRSLHEVTPKPCSLFKFLFNISPFQLDGILCFFLLVGVYLFHIPAQKLILFTIVNERFIKELPASIYRYCGSQLHSKFQTSNKCKVGANSNNQTYMQFLRCFWCFSLIRMKILFYNLCSTLM